MEVKVDDGVKSGEPLFTAFLGGRTTTVTSPIDGRVDSVAIAKGSPLSEGTEVAVIVGGSGGAAVPRKAPTSAAPPPPAAAPISSQPPPTDGTAVTASLPGTVMNILVREGQEVAEGDVLMTVESMKMEIEIPSTASGRVASLAVGPGSSVTAGKVLAVIGG